MRSNATVIVVRMVGDIVNLSARLMKAAGKGVLCDEQTYIKAKSR